MRLTIIIVVLCAVSCFEDAGGSPDDASGTATTTSSSSTTDGGSTSEPDGTGTETGTESSGDETSETGQTSGSGSGACTVESCPDGEFCVDGVCEDEPPDGMIVIPEGTFHYGCNGDADCEEDEKPADPELFISTFAIDHLEVTVEDYAGCVDDETCDAAATDDPVCNWGRPGYEDHPINCVTWFQAEAYCAWAGKRLPTEAEWEKAARGTDARRYPWGEDTPSCELAVIVTDGYGCGTGETWPVGSKPGGASPYGVLNVGGNVREWVSDWYQPFLEAGSPDPQGPETGTQRATRGASLINGDNSSFRVGNRSRREPDGHAFHLGFRCAAG